MTAGRWLDYHAAMTAASPPELAPPPVQTKIAALVARPVFWILAILFFGAWPVARTMSLRVPPTPPVLGSVTPFELTDHEDQAFGASRLEGRAWLGTAVCSSCSHVPPQLLTALRKVQHRTRNLGAHFRIVSMSVTAPPEGTAALAALAHEQRASRRAWSFVTGDPAVIRRVARELWSIDDDPGPQTPAVGADHSWQVVLVDRRQRIRGRYDLRRPDGMTDLMRDLTVVMARPERSGADAR